ncbi:MAG: aminomethyl transferase family protein [Deltaproteobacteria bacterium]|nr:aminomethyl transferase family protein [Deltaproteobacteria bacterium]
MSTRALTTRVREGVGLFAMDERGLLEVRGSDRIRWLDGMLSADVKALEKRGEGAGAPALFLTHRGAIVADFHVGRLGDALLLECQRSEIPRIRAALEKRIIADDVELVDRSDRDAVLGAEGARASDVVARALDGDGAAGGGPAAVADVWPERWAMGAIAGAPVLLAGFGWSGERAVQIRVAPAGRDAVRAALVAAAGELGVDCVEGDRALLEVLRIEAGIPALGAELDEDVLPPEARLERTLAINKGCYVGQEIVARLRSRGQVNHLLVGLRREGGAEDLVVGASLSAAGRVTGEITSVALSPTEGAIALAYVRREHAEPGTALALEGFGSVRVVALPIVAPASAAGAPGAAGEPGLPPSGS